MKKLKQYHFWYGAILNAILECNPDSTPTLLERTTEKSSILKITTNTSSDYIILCKFAKEKGTKGNNYNSWQFVISEDDKVILDKYYNNNYPVFIFFLCATETLKDSEIAICTYEEFQVVRNKHSLNIGREKKSRYFNLHVSQSRNNCIKLNRSRIEMSTDEILNELIYFDPEHYKSKINNPIKIDVSNLSTRNSSKMIKYLSINYNDNDICPIHNIKMSSINVITNLGEKENVYYCNECCKFMITQNKYNHFIKHNDHKNNVGFIAIKSDVDTFI